MSRNAPPLPPPPLPGSLTPAGPCTWPVQRLALRTGAGLSLVWTRLCALALYRILVCIFKHCEGRGWEGREGGWEQTETEGHFEFRAKEKKKKKAMRLPLQESQIASVSRYPLLFLPFLRCNLAPPFLSFILLSPLFSVARGASRPRSPSPPVYCGAWSLWLACCRVPMSVGKQSLSRMPRSLWQSNSSMNPYQ